MFTFFFFFAVITEQIHLEHFLHNLCMITMSVEHYMNTPILGVHVPRFYVETHHETFGRVIGK
jgi:hypothetical protein